MRTCRLVLHLLPMLSRTERKSEAQHWSLSAGTFTGLKLMNEKHYDLSARKWAREHKRSAFRNAMWLEETAFWPLTYFVNQWRNNCILSERNNLQDIAVVCDLLAGLDPLDVGQASLIGIYQTHPQSTFPSKVPQTICAIRGVQFSSTMTHFTVCARFCVWQNFLFAKPTRHTRLYSWKVTCSKRHKLSDISEKEYVLTKFSEWCSCRSCRGSRLIYMMSDGEKTTWQQIVCVGKRRDAPVLCASLAALEMFCAVIQLSHCEQHPIPHCVVLTSRRRLIKLWSGLDWRTHGQSELHAMWLPGPSTVVTLSHPQQYLHAPLSVFGSLLWLDSELHEYEHDEC